MIKVIASDMDGTLLGDDHMPAPETIAAVKRACDAGIRFMIATGRNFPGAMEQLQGCGLTCDYIVSSGAEVRNPAGEIVQVNPLGTDLVRDIYERVKDFPISVIFCTDGDDYRLGTPEEVEEGLILQLQTFHLGMSREELIRTDLYRRMKKRTKSFPALSELDRIGSPFYKLFLFSMDTDLLARVSAVLEKDDRIAVASSFETNLEITAVEAQKGPVLKSYIESLGYQMDEVMVLGDSLNDYSMISMDFGATVAMENAVPEIKKAAKYITKTNAELGVAFAIDRLLENGGNAEILRRR